MPKLRSCSLDDIRCNKWRDITQSLRQSSVLFTFLYAKRIKTVNLNM